VASDLSADTTQNAAPGAPPDGAPPPLSQLGPEHALALAAPGDVLTSHTFDADAQGWTKFFDCTTAVSWDPAGQFIRSGKECLNVPPPPPPYGCIYWHWDAPQTFITPARQSGAAYGSTLSYDLSMTNAVGEVGTNGLDVAVRGFSPEGGTKWIATYGVVTSLHTDFRHYAVQLDNSRSWVLWDGTSTPASPEMVQSVVSSMFMLQIRGSYKYVCEQGNGSSLDNVQIVAGGAPPPHDPLEVSTTTLPVRTDTGWYLNNPFSVTVTLENPGTASIPGDFSLEIYSDDGKARFYVYESDLWDDTPGVVIERGFHGLHSLRSFKATRTGSTIDPGEEQVLVVKLWGQPSEATLLRARLTWQGKDHYEAVAVDTASIHPVVFLHGIQGSQPPQFRLIRDRDTAKDLLDPFTNAYVPLLDNLVKMGYEWDRTLFAFAYNWMRSNDRSGRELAWRLGELVLPRAAEVPWSAFYQNPGAGRADLIGHSNGGLVARAYVQSGGYAGDVRKLITLGTPHRGFAFDYKTWEHGEWEDYMQHADAVLPGASLLFEKANEYLLWPAFVTRRYRPDPDLYPKLKFPFNPFNRYVYYTGSGYRLIPFNDLYDFMHDEGRGVHSLRQLLPVDDLGATAKDGTKAYLLGLNGRAFPYGHERNFWLERLNKNIWRLETRLGLDNIYAVYGAGVDTSLAYRVLGRGKHGWRFGKPLPLLTITGSGDSLILEESASLEGLLELGASNKGRLDEESYGSLGPVTHTPLVYHPYTQQGLIPLYLTGAGAPFHTPWERPDICAAGRKLVRSTLGPRWQQITEFVLGRVVPEVDPFGFCPASGH
jgi:pimeloyl-ACP methyl ester carboxylesterase